MLAPPPPPVPGPLAVQVRPAPATVRCAADGSLALAVGARWSAKARARPVRSIRVLLQRPGSEGVVDSVTFAPAATKERRGVLRASRCLPHLDLRYELFVGKVDRPHDHTSVRFRFASR